MRKEESGRESMGKDAPAALVQTLELCREALEESEDIFYGLLSVKEKRLKESLAYCGNLERIKKGLKDTLECNSCDKRRIAVYDENGYMLLILMSKPVKKHSERKTARILKQCLKLLCTQLKMLDDCPLPPPKIACGRSPQLLSPLQTTQGAQTVGRRQYEDEMRTIDKQANRFLRHELKNGILTCLIETDRARQSIEDMAKGEIVSHHEEGDGLSLLSTTPPVPGGIDELVTGITKSLPSMKILKGQDSIASGQDEDESTAEKKGRKTAENALSAIDSIAEELSNTLDVLLSASMVTSILSGNYVPKEQLVDLASLCGTACGQPESRVLVSPERCIIETDPGLIKFVLSNAISNANKYGSKTDPILVDIDIDDIHSLDQSTHSSQGSITSSSSSSIPIDVSRVSCDRSVVDPMCDDLDISNHSGIPLDNESQLVRVKISVVNKAGPDHERLRALTNPNVIFEPGKRCHDIKNDNDFGRSISSGDGAWIMLKCAESLEGSCMIEFKEDETFFLCTILASRPRSITPSRPRHIRRITVDNIPGAWVTQYSQAPKFSLPSDTVLCGLDDSAAQRRWLFKMFQNMGPGLGNKIWGDDPKDLERFVPEAFSLVSNSPPSTRFVFFLDKHLHYQSSGKCFDTVSASGIDLGNRLILELKRSKLHKRVLVLLRTADDDVTDQDSNEKSLLHGFFPKSVMSAESCLQVIEPLWNKHFGIIPLGSIPLHTQN